MLPAKLPSKQLQVIWYSVINSIIHQWWSGKCYCLLPKYLYLTRTWLKKYLMYLMSSKYSEYLNLYLYLQIWKSTCTWLKYFEKYLTPTLLAVRLFSGVCHRTFNLATCNEKSTSVPVMAWCRQATIHYLSQCWPRYKPYGVTRSQWVNHYDIICHPRSCHHWFR